jgi:non-homologous end joining protein Ku
VRFIAHGRGAQTPSSYNVILVAIYPAAREEKLSFRQLRPSDLSLIRYKKVAEADSKV